MKPATISLIMICKDEAHCISRALESVKPLITHWTVCDTGSTDGTPDLVRRCMGDVPGELFERPWRGFSGSRNEAIELSRGKTDYVLELAADDVIEIAPGF